MNTFSVGQLNSYIKSFLESDLSLKNIQVLGEISNFKDHSSGHFYFTLKDENARINAVMFASYAKRLNIKLENGMKIIASGSIGVYPQGGSYQLYVTNIEPVGLGSLYLKFEQLKKQLAEEGLFEDYRKKIIPKFPKSIGVISAKEGAAIRDVITTIKRRYPLVKITLIPSLVQGKNATFEVSEALKKADSLGFDTIIVARGGGSIEDLWCFNEELVARTVATMKTPLISAIGHETDFTIIDFVSDKRAATPTAAAELATPNIAEIIATFDQYLTRINNAFKNNLENNQNILNKLSTSSYLTKPEMLYANKGMQLNFLSEKLFNMKDKIIMQTKNILDTKNEKLRVLINKAIETNKNNLGTIIAKFSSLNPLNVLTRGYGMIEINNHVINSTKEAKIGDEMKVILNDGSLKAKIIDKEEK